ncbi:MAG: hypothetical protein KC729_05020 [Candidatus Eisenbacteria bacterium]|uniref:Uncharacterized protein n=1 Tax=Eiseniibacteriota bacterium TaxID=2212470 RepID=A0A956LWY4_UNCEI|nr:hypothetical protein [Candidatus Eisenbacteria bacterium]
MSFWQWVRATTLGWLLGFVLVIVLSLVWELFGGVQFMVGAGIGAGVGYLQGRALASVLGRSYRWMVASTVGMGAPFLLTDVLHLAGLGLPYSLPRNVLYGAIVIGVWQAQLLRPVSRRSVWWIPACLYGWAIPAGAIALGDSQAPRALKVIGSFGGIFLGGALLGLATAGCLTWILRRPCRRPMFDDVPG